MHPVTGGVQLEPSNQIKTIAVPEFPLWEKAKKVRTLLSLSLELTARCNNNCVHCYINTPENDVHSIRGELSFTQWTDLIDEACNLGALWILFSGGEPLLREDFFDLYIYAKKKGMLVAVFSNGSLISPKHVKLFKSYPPRALEITVYGVSRTVHRRVTRADFFTETMAGIDLLKQNAIPITLKAVAMKSNFNEMQQIFKFCQKYSDRATRIDAFLHFRYDRDTRRNKEILGERLSPEEFIAVDKLYQRKCESLRKQCQQLDQIRVGSEQTKASLRCSAGINSCCISFDGKFALCSSLISDDLTYDLKNGSLKEAWEIFTPKIRQKRTSSLEYINNCNNCDLFNICPYCAGHALLEGGSLEAHLLYYCEIGKKRYLEFTS